MDVLDSFGETLRQVAPVLLVAPGVILIASGLFLWLGGLRLLRPLASFFAAGAGFLCAWVFTEREPIPVACFVLIPAALALFLEKPVIVVLGACLAAGAALVFPLFADAAVRQAIDDGAGPVPIVQEMSVFDGATYVESLSAWAEGWGRAFWAALSDGRKAMAVGVLVGVLALGIIAWRWVCALTCATLGTGMILVGLTALVLSKGPQTIPYLADIRPYLWPVVGGMVTAGTLLNRWLGPAKVIAKKPTEPHVQGDGK